MPKVAMQWIRTFVFLALVSGAGVATGFAGMTAAAPHAQATECEDDECEGGRKCQDNPGGRTECGFEGKRCSTDACAY